MAFNTIHIGVRRTLISHELRFHRVAGQAAKFSAFRIRVRFVAADCPQYDECIDACQNKQEITPMPGLAKIDCDFSPPEAPPVSCPGGWPAVVGWRNRRRITIPAPWLPFLIHLSSPIPNELEQIPRQTAHGNIRCCRKQRRKNNFLSWCGAREDVSWLPENLWNLAAYAVLKGLKKGLSGGELITATKINKMALICEYYCLWRLNK